MATIFRPKIKQVIGNGTSAHKLQFTPGKRVHGAQFGLQFPAGTSYDTLAEDVPLITAIRLMAGTRNLWEGINGTKLRDFLLLFGTKFDFNMSTTGSVNSVLLTLPFAPEWFIESVQDTLALNPARLGAPLSLEIDFNAVAVTTTAWEFIDDNLNAPSNGYIDLRLLKTKAAGTEFVVGQPELKAEGQLLCASIYPDSGNSREIGGVGSGVSFQVGGDKRFVHENVNSEQNDEELERKGLTPAASGRSSNIYDFVPVKGDSLNRAVNLDGIQSWLTIGAASAMDGTCDIVVARLMPNPQ